MAEAIVSLLLEKVTSFAQDEILKAATAKAEVEKLEAKLKAIQPIARDAHNKQFLSKEVKDWVWRLNEVAYDALDVIELYRIKSRCAADPTDSLQQKVLKKTLKSVVNFPKKVYLLHKIGTKVKEINERLDAIDVEKRKYNLQPMLRESSSLGENLTLLVQDRLTTSAIKETNIIGREEDEEVVIKWLCEESNSHDQQSPSIIAIVGMGGVGKTALAQNIYHNCSERGCFDKCMWVCVAEMPKVLNLLKKILEEVEREGSSSNQLSSANTIHSKIRSHLKNKNFLLVLDDVWDYGWWNELRSIWQDCGSRSKVLITTRQVQFDEDMVLVHSHKLKCLNEEQSCHLLLNKALRRGESEEDLSAVKDVGRDIARKCGGLPLALSAVGSLLRQKERRKSEWQIVLHSPFWNWQGPKENKREVFSAVALSYMSISYQLKQCLTYCCMYPKDFEIRKEDLVRLWVAEGFIIKEQGLEIEATAERYLHTLVGCSLIQDAGYNRYKLHDIIHDFCLHVRENEYAHMSQLTDKYRARYVSSFGGDYSSEALRQQGKLRGLICHEVDCLSAYNFDAFRWLRVLDLSGGDFYELPESIGDLILLKYVNLSRTTISELPESITKLSELQTLDLSYSRIKTLPNRISALGALRNLDISWTGELEYLPRGIGKLTGLQTLPKFIVSRSNISDGMGSSLLELGELNNLKGSLTIEHLERVDSLEEVDHAQLKRKGGLQRLVLECERECFTQFNKDVIEKVEQVYERMQPPTSIEEISIRRYSGMKCPTWMGSSKYSYLRKISITLCPFLKSLPNLGLLPNLVELMIAFVDTEKVLDFTLDHVGEKITFPKLQVLSIRSVNMVKVLDFEKIAFPKLEALTLEFMGSLEEWQFDAEIGNMPCLHRLYILECPKLKVIPSFSTLEDLTVKNVAEWEGWFMAKERDMPSLRWLYIDRCPKLRVIPSFSTLEHLTVKNVIEWEGWFIAKERDMPCLKKMHISSCRKLKFLPTCPRLEEMSIKWCAQLVELPHLSPVLVSATIKGCHSISCIQNIEAAKELKHLEIVDCPRLQSLPLGLQCGNLKTLVIKYCNNLTSGVDSTASPVESFDSF